MERWGQGWIEQERRARAKRSKQQHRWRLLFATVSSLLLHLLVLVVVRQLVFQQTEDPSIVTGVPEYMEVSFHTRPPPASESQFPEGNPVSAGGQGNTALPAPGNRQEAKIEDVDDIDSSLAVENTPAPMIEADTEMEAVEGRNADGPDGGFDRQLLQNSIDEMLTTHRQQQSENWLRECMRKRNARLNHDCNEDPDFLDDPIAEEKAMAERAFAVVLRDQQQRNVTLARKRENSVLEDIIERQNSPLVETMARRQHNLNREVIAYLNGNFNDNYWNFLQAAFSHDQQLGFSRSLAEPRCWDGPCIFEYTPPKQAERNEEETSGFSITPALFPMNGQE